MAATGWRAHDHGREQRSRGWRGHDHDRALRTGAGGRPVIVVELRKLISRPRVWLSIVLLCAVPALVAVLLSISNIAPPPGQGGAFLSAVVSNGSLYPAAALAMVLP